MSFEAALREIVAPGLQPFGYEYAAGGRGAHDLFEFRKSPQIAEASVVQFQLRHSAPECFTVNLLSSTARARGARLSTVLWYVYDLREYLVSDYWWPATEAALRDVAQKIVQYGVPWIEDADAPQPWEMPAHNGHEFVEAIELALGPALQRCGYRLVVQRLSGEVPYPYFVKVWPDGTRGFVEIQSVYSLDPHEFQFDVRVQRRVDENPLALAARPGASLAQLAWQARDTAVEAATVAEARTLLWHYANRAELDAQLCAALVEIEQFGLPWIDRAGI